MMIIVLILTLICAVLAIHASRVLVAVLWLALVSVLTGLLLYLVDAWLIAVIELSVGTGLVTVLMVFVITMIGDEREVIPPNDLRLPIVILTVLLISLLTVPFIPDTAFVSEEPLKTVLWQVRGLDILPQIALIFVSMIGVLALLSENNSAESISQEHTEEAASAELITHDEQTLAEQEAA